MDRHEIPAASDAAPVHDWMSEVFRSLREEVWLYLRTAFLITFQPKKLVADWKAGTLKPMNPFVYFGMALAVLVPIESLVYRLFLPSKPDLPLWMDVLSPLVPYASEAAVGLVANLLLRLLGSRRPIGATLAMVLYVQGGPNTMLQLIGLPLPVVISRRNAGQDMGIWGTIAGVFVTLLFAISLVLLARAIAALHGVGRRAVVLVVLIAPFAGAAVEIPFSRLTYVSWSQMHDPKRPEFQRGVAFRRSLCKRYPITCPRAAPSPAPPATPKAAPPAL